MLKIPHNLIFTAEGFILNPKRFYVEGQSHAARVIHDKTIKHKEAQIPYLTGLDPYYLLKLMRLWQQGKTLRKTLSPNKNNRTTYAANDQ